MGLGTVELVMEIEDTFNVSIPDADAERMQTPADVADWLMTHILPPAKPSPACATAGIFYEIRRDLITSFPIDRRAVVPAARLADLILKQSGRAWRQFRRKHNLPRRGLADFGPFRTALANPELTIRDVVDLSAVTHESNWFDADGQIIRERVLNAVRWITSEQTGVSLHDIKPDTLFIHELHLD